MKKILLIEDEVGVVSFIKKGLEEIGYEISVAFDGNTALSMVKNNEFDLLILDIMLPDINGLEVCKKVRETDKIIPILFLTALGSSENIVVGLESGGDDYLVKPFKFVELVARIKSLIRRSSHANISEQVDFNQKDIFSFEDLQVNDYTKKVSRGGKDISLTSTEYKLLMYFLLNPGKVISRTEILEAVWDVNYDLSTNVVDVYVNYLRKKIESGFSKKLIHTVIGMGYVLKNSDD